jgi:hypothetical protein
VRLGPVALLEQKLAIASGAESYRVAFLHVQDEKSAS